MSGGKVKNIVILGGGSAGWMTASYLKKAHPEFNISLVESSDIPIIGVGEATIAHLAQFMLFLGLEEKNWMPACNASYKYAIRFKNWHEIGDSYWHPFEAIPSFDNSNHLGFFWWYDRYKNNPERARQSFYSDCFMGVDLLNQNLIPKHAGSRDFVDYFDLTVDGQQQRQQVGYAYHFDAGLFGDYLKREVARPMGVNHIIDEVTKVNLKEDGFIDSLDTKNGQTIQGDLFVDCSGFLALLIDKTYHEPFDYYSDTLFCDRAIAMQVPYENKFEETHPYTTATALSSGWVWNTPLTNRRGTGYVYCSSFKTEDEAEIEYRQFLGEDRVKDLQARHIKIRVGKHRRTWVKNCVAIGLSSGFIEPLESTGIHFIHISALRLAEALEGGYFNVGDIDAYNWYTDEMMQEVREFLSLHYALTQREDSAFWREVKYNTKLQGIAPEMLSKGRTRFPVGHSGYIFQNSSWVCILNGMNHLPIADPYLQVSQEVLNKQQTLIKGMYQLKSQIAGQIPNHADYLNRLAEMANK